MACFKLTINGTTYQLPTDGSNNLDSLVGSLTSFKFNNPDAYRRFCQALLDNKSQPIDSKIKPLSIKEQRDFLPALQDNLKQAGIVLHTTFDEFQNAIAENDLDPNAKSFVLKGEIFINPNNFNITDAFHEMSHLFFAVFKIKSPKQYVTLLNDLLKDPQIQQIFMQLQKIGNRSDLGLEADLKEEAVMQFIEKVLSDQLPLSDYESVIDLIDQNLQPILKEMFGLKIYPGFITFMKSFITDITTFGGMASMLPKLDSTGFIEYRQHAIKSAGVSDYIQILAQDGKLKKGECK